MAAAATPNRQAWCCAPFESEPALDNKPVMKMPVRETLPNTHDRLGKFETNAIIWPHRTCCSALPGAVLFLLCTSCMLESGSLLPWPGSTHESAVLMGPSVFDSNPRRAPPKPQHQAGPGGAERPRLRSFPLSTNPTLCTIHPFHPSHPRTHDRSIRLLAPIRSWEWFAGRDCLPPSVVLDDITYNPVNWVSQLWSAVPAVPPFPHRRQGHFPLRNQHPPSASAIGRPVLHFSTSPSRSKP